MAPGQSGQGPRPDAPPPPPGGPRVSVLVPTCDRAAMLPEALDSALAQRGAEVEVIAVDDGSSDATSEVLARYAGRVRALRHSRNRGKAAALNTAIEAATGEWLLVLDDDDRLLPGQVQAQIAWAALHPGCGGVFADCVRSHGGTGEALGVHAALDVPPAWVAGQAALRVPFMPGTLLLRAEVQRRAGPYREELRRGQDIDLFVRAAAVADLVGMPAAVQEVRVHSGARGGAGFRFQAEEHRARHLQVSAAPFATLLRSLDDDALVPGAGRSPARRAQAALHRALALALRERWDDALEALRAFDPAWASPACPALLRHLASRASMPAAEGGPGPGEAARLLPALAGAVAACRRDPPALRVLVVDDGEPSALGSVLAPALAAAPDPPQVWVWSRARREPRDPYVEAAGAVFVDAPPEAAAGAVLERMCAGPWEALELRATRWGPGRAVLALRAEYEARGGFDRGAATLEEAVRGWDSG